MIKLFSALIAIGLLSGCANTYTLEGKLYKGEERFEEAVHSARTDALQSITTLPAPLTQKRLIAILPSSDAIYNANTQRIKAETRRTPQGQAQVLVSTLSKSNYKLVRVMYESVAKRGIFRDVEIRDADSMAVSVEPSLDYDVLYYTEPGINSGQYFYSSVKHGKQVFAYDRSVVGPTAKVNAFVDAVQTMAIRN